MQGLELIKDLAEIEHELAEKLDEARRSAEQRVKKAGEEAQDILAGADAEVRKIEDEVKARIAEECQKYAEEAHRMGETEAQRIRQQADSNIQQAVDFVLSKVLP